MTGLVRAELKKITSTRLWWGLLIGALGFAALQSLVTAVFSGVEAGAGQPTMPGLDTDEAIRAVYPMAMFTGTYMFALVLGITGMTGEYRYQTITSTFLVSPRRHRVVTAKILAHAGMGVVYALLGLLVVLVVGGTAMAVRGYGLGFDAERLWVTMGLAVAAVAIWAVVGIGIGTLVRNQVAAIVLAILFTFLVEPLLTFALAAAEMDWLVKWLPSNASSALMAPGEVLVDYLDWWVGGLVLLAYGLVLAGVGVLLSVRRDVS
ncbi:MAG TPA: ABC transporter permease [Nocardioidaceae bacterium]|nr:ABC transporter permease [Nocardioidaceae bacterium]